MKVLFVHDGPLYSNDNANFYGIHFNDALRLRYLELGDHVTFLMRVYPFDQRDVKKLSFISNEQFNVISVPNFKSIRAYWKNSRLARKIANEAVAQTDIVVARMPSAVGGMAVRAARKYNKPLLVEYVACTFDAYWNYNWKGKLIAHYKMLEQKRIMKDVPFTIYVTEKFLQQRYPTHGRSISCSDVVLQPIVKKDLVTRLEKIGAMNNEHPIHLGTVAALDVPYKGQADVIKAIARLKKEGRIFRYTLVGQGDPSRLKTLISELNVEDCVTVAGPLKHEQVFDFFETIDVYIQPSKQEGLPRAVVEAMSKACPCLGARTAGIPELISGEMVFEKGNISGIVSKLKSLNKDVLMREADRNFKKSFEFQHDILQQKRRHFYETFLKLNNLSR